MPIHFFKVKKGDVESDLNDPWLLFIFVQIPLNIQYRRCKVDT